ncbi:hypothetical protein Tco_1389520, partial [Tanacetum coccineum]
MKVFNNMKRPTKGYLGQEVALFPSMLHVSSPSPIPSPSPEPTPDHTTAVVTQPSPTQPSPTYPSPILPSPGTEHHLPTPHYSPLHFVHSHGSDEGSLRLNELTVLVTKLYDKIGVLMDDLRVKIGKSKRRAKVILSEDDEDIADDSSKQGRKLSDTEVQDKVSNETEPVIQDVTPTEVIQDQESSEKGSA